MTAIIPLDKLHLLNKPKPMLVVLSGPSGTGKSTIVRELRKRQLNFVESVSATTRPRRKGERDGKDYYFLTLEQFRNKLKRGEFIETVRLFDEHYGTPEKPVLDALKKGHTVLFDIDIRGGRSIKRWRKDSVLIFILPPSFEVLKQRLTLRKSETPASLKRRLGRALKEMKNWTKYDYVVCNDDLAETVSLIEVLSAANPSEWRVAGQSSSRTERQTMKNVDKQVLLLDKLDDITLNHYVAVLAAAKRARQINAKRLAMLEKLTENSKVEIDYRKVTSIALEDMLTGKVKFEQPKVTG